uniref:Uncharacterized protein n=1 Tax=Romanomermis culicivorax TaxID=13658 RepID=A0A915IPN2_ROMCU
MNEDWSFNQPVRVCTIEKQLLVLDAGNNRVKIFEETPSPIYANENAHDLGNAPSSFSESMSFNLKKIVTGEPLAFQSTVGLTKTPQKTFMTLNWRTKCITEWSLSNDALLSSASNLSFTELKSFTFSEFVEPLDVAVDSEGRVLVCDNGAKKVFVFDHNARPQFSFTVKSSLEMDAANNVCAPPTITNLTAGGEKVQQRRRRGSKDEKNDQPSFISNLPTSFTLGANGKVVSSVTPQTASRHNNVISNQNMQLSCIAIGPNDDIIVGGNEIQIYDHCGRYIANILPHVANNTGSLPVKILANAGFFVGGLAVDNDGYVLATVSDSKGGHIAVCRCLSPAEKNVNASPARYAIDSSAAKLRRPSGICVANENFCFVADLGNNCIKKYRYK